jgi:hypothetical protein
MTGVASYVVSYSLNPRPIVTLINANYVFTESANQTFEDFQNLHLIDATTCIVSQYYTNPFSTTDNILSIFIGSSFVVIVDETLESYESLVSKIKIYLW